MKKLIGHKAGGDVHIPVESPDSLHSVAYAKVLDLVAEGPIQGLVNGMQSVYLDETPLANADGSLNFKDVIVDARTGTQDQQHISGFPAVETEHPVGIELKDGEPWVRELRNLNLSAVRMRLSVPQLQQSQDNGDVTGYRIEYTIEVSTDDGAYQKLQSTAFDGKTTSTYTRSHRIDLPRATTKWTLRVTRVTPKQNSSRIADSMVFDAYTEVVDVKLRYPMSALMGLKFDARQFQSIPSRAYDVRLKIVKVPSNYDPETRTYDGVWDGSFKPAWSDNPAWCFYDLVLNDRFGLGHRINASQVDKWALYEIGRYCDVMVPDGKGGMEPRFTLNVYLQSRAAAYKVLQDIAGIFRGMSFYAAGSVVATADMPKDPVYTYTAANVIGGQFTLTGSSRRTRYTSANIAWNDPADFYRSKVVHVEDPEGLARYGDRLTEVSPLGCTSEGQAQRVGQWMLLTSRLETQGITFSVGLEGYVALPGQIVRVADPKRMGRRNGGRIRSATGNVVTLDKAPLVAVGDRLTVILPSAVAETRSVVAVDGDNVTVETDWSELPQPQSIWAVDSIDLVAPTYRIVAVRDKGGMIFEISAIQHEPGKFAAIDSGARIETRPITVIPPSVQPPPSNVALSTYTVIDQGIATTVMNVAWTAAPSAVAYQVEWRRDNGDWVRMPATGSINVDVSGIYAGGYVARVRAINVMQVSSAPAVSVLTQLDGNTSPPPVVAALNTVSKVWGIGLVWSFPTGPNTIERTEIWYGQTANRESAIKLGEFAYPQSTHELMGLRAGVGFWFWARLVDRSGNIGEWYPAGAGVRGESSAATDAILEDIAGKVTRSALGQELLAEIDSTTGLAAELTDLTAQVTANTNADIALAGDIQASEQRQAAALTDEALKRAQEDAALLASQLAQAALVAQNADAIESETQARSQALDAQAGQIADNAAKTSQEIADRIALGDTLGAQISSVSTVVGAQASRVDALVSRADGFDSSVIALQQVDAGQAVHISALQVQTDTLTNRITEVDTVNVDLAQRVINLTATAGDTDSAINELTEAGRGYVRTLQSLTVKSGSAESQIIETREVTAAQATQLLALSTQVDGAETNISTLSQTTGELATRMSTVEASAGASSSAITGLESATSALAMRASGLETRAGDAEGRIQNVETTAGGQATQISALTGRVGAAESGITQLFDVTGTQATATTTLATRVGTTESGIVDIKQTSAGQATQLSTLTVRADGVDGSIGSLNGSVTNLTNVQADLVNRTSSLEVSNVSNISRLGTVETVAAASASRSTVLETRANAADGAIAGIGTSISGLQTTDVDLALELIAFKATVGDADGELSRLTKVTSDLARTSATLRVKTADTESSIERVDQVIAGQASSIEQMSSRTGLVEAGLVSESVARTNANAALAIRIDTLTATTGTVAAELTSESTVRSTENAALASRIDTVTATANDASAAVQVVKDAQSNTDGKLAAMYSVKVGVTVDGTYYQAGIGVGVESTSDGVVQEQVYALADRFAVLNLANGVTTTPFVVENGQVLMNMALIGQARITSAMIESLDAGKVNADYLSAINANLGTVIAGRLQNNANPAQVTAFIDMNAVGSNPFIRVEDVDRPETGPAIMLTANGSGVFKRTVVSAPDILKQDILPVNINMPGAIEDPNRLSFEVLIDTGYTFLSAWYEAPSVMLLASARISGGTSLDIGSMGLGEATVLTGQGLATGNPGGVIDQRVYIRFRWTMMSPAQNPIQITGIAWKLTSV